MKTFRIVLSIISMICLSFFVVACGENKDDTKKTTSASSKTADKKDDTSISQIDPPVQKEELTYETFITDECPLMKNIYHRGMGAVAPECTEQAYRLAAKAGYKYAENDLWFTSDGYPVMVHMKDLSVTSNGKGNVTDVTLEYLKSLDFGNANKFGDKYKGTKVLTFEEWIALCKELNIKPYIDCKMFAQTAYDGKHGIATCFDILDKYGMRNDATWIVGVSGAISVRDVDKNARIAIIATENPTDEQFEQIKSFADPNNRDKVVLNMASGMVTKELVEKYNSVNINVEAWVADENAYKNHARVVSLYKMGVTGLTNDGVNIGLALKNAGFTW